MGAADGSNVSTTGVVAPLGRVLWTRFSRERTRSAAARESWFIANSTTTRETPLVDVEWTDWTPLIPLTASSIGFDTVPATAPGLAPG